MTDSLEKHGSGVPTENDLQSQIATADDLANTWARQEGVSECDSPYKNFGLRALIGRLWDKSSSRILDGRSQAIADVVGSMKATGFRDVLEECLGELEAFRQWRDANPDEFSDMDKERIAATMKRVEDALAAFRKKFNLDGK